MPKTYGRDLDLNLLRVFAVVADCGSVTEAASRLYLTQPAVSAALRRLTQTIGAPLFARRGRGLVLTARGQQLLERMHPHLERLVDAALATPTFDPKTSERVLRLGLSDTAEAWLLPALLKRLVHAAPHIRVICVPVQFRNVGAVLASSLDLAVTVADPLPPSIRRQALYHSRFSCVFDPRHAKIKRRGKLSEAQYFAHEHVIVSYNADLRGIVEDLFGKARNVRCSIASFTNLGALIDGTAMLATVPDLVATQLLSTHPHLAKTAPPFEYAGAPLEMLWPSSLDDDEPCKFIRAEIAAIARTLGGSKD